MRFLRSTLRDSNTTVSLVDLTTEANAGVIRGLEAGPGIKLRTVDADETKHVTKQKKVIISFDGAPGVGENNTGANFGGGLGVFRDKTGTTLNFRTLTAGGAVELTTVGDTILISARSITSLGQLINNQGFVSAAQFVGGGDVTVSLLGNDIRISANAGGITSITQTNLGAGAPIILSISGTSDIRHRPIVGAGAIQISASPTQITISAAPNPTALSQLTNDQGFLSAAQVQAFGYITQASANAAYVGIGSLSSLSQFNNNQGFVSAAQFTGGGIISVQVSGTTAGREIRISANGTLITSTSLGTGQAIITGVSAGRDIQHRTIVGGGAIQVSGGATEITISAAPNPTLLSQLTNNVGFITNISTSAPGGGQNLIVGTSANEITFRTFTGGGAVSVTTVGNTINISANTGAGNTTVEQTPLGGGQAFIVSISGTTDIQHRTLVVGGSIQLSASPTQITLSAAPVPTLLSQLSNNVGFVSAAQFTGGGAVSVFVSGTGAGLEIRISANTGDAGNNWIIANGDANFVSAPTTIGLNAISIGNAARTNGQNGLAIGTSASSGDFAVAIGNGAVAGDTFSIAIGQEARSLSGYAISIGASAQAPSGGMQIRNRESDITQYQTGEFVVSGARAQIVLPNYAGNANYPIGFAEGATIYDSVEDAIVTFDGTNWNILDTTIVTETPLGGGEAVIVSISAGRDIRHRTIVATGAIQLSASPTEITISAAPNPTLLSELLNDVGFITEASANLVFVNEGDLSALSQFANDVGFINQVSALGGGETLYIATSGTELQFKTITGSGNIEVTTSGNTIKVSAAGGGSGLLTVEDESVQISTTIDTLNFVNQELHNNGEQIIVSADANVLTINTYIPKMYSVRVNMANGTNPVIDTTTPVSNLPVGWTFNSLEGGTQSTAVINIPVEVQRPPRSVTLIGFSIGTGAHKAFGGTNNVNAEWRVGQPGVLRLNINTAALAASSGTTGSHVTFELLY